MVGLFHLIKREIPLKKLLRSVLELECVAGCVGLQERGKATLQANSGVPRKAFAIQNARIYVWNGHC